MVEEENICKISVPLISDGEIKQIDSYLDDIVHQFTRQLVHDKDLAIAQHIIQKQQEELKYKERKYRDLKLKYEQNLKMCKHFREELNKQDKIINEMANYIIIHHQVKTMKKTFCEDCTKCKGIDRDCIKQYFEKKAEV